MASFFCDNGGVKPSARYVFLNLLACALVVCALASVGGFKGSTSLLQGNLFYVFLVAAVGAVYLAIRTLPAEERLTRLWEPVVVLLVTFSCSAIVIPVLVAARPASSKATCLSNIKHLGSGLLIYATDHDDRLPLVSNWHIAATPYWEKDPSIRKCPQAEEPFTYAMNQAMSGLSLKKMADREQRVLLYESTSPTGSFVKRHRERGSVFFADGHAKLIENKPGEAKW